MVKQAAKIILLTVFLVTSLWAKDVRSIQYRSTKISSYNQQKINSEAHIYMDGTKVKIDFLHPEKRTLIWNNKVYVIEYTESNQKKILDYKYEDVPIVVRQMLVPSIFSAGTFMQTISKGYTLTISKNISIATPLEPKNISRIEYLYNKQKDQINYYKIYGRDGGLISETRFSDYKVFNNTYILPTKIQTIINGQDGLIEDTEIFSRIKVDQPIDSKEFNI